MSAKTLRSDREPNYYLVPAIIPMTMSVNQANDSHDHDGTLHPTLGGRTFGEQYGIRRSTTTGPAGARARAEVAEAGARA